MSCLMDASYLKEMSEKTRVNNLDDLFKMIRNQMITVAENCDPEATILVPNEYRDAVRKEMENSDYTVIIYPTANPNMSEFHVEF